MAKSEGNSAKMQVEIPAHTVRGSPQKDAGTSETKPWYAKLFSPWSLVILFAVLLACTWVMGITLYFKVASDLKTLRSISYSNLKECRRGNKDNANEIKKWTEQRIATLENSTRQYIDALKTSNAMDIHKLQKQSSGRSSGFSSNASLLTMRSEIESLTSTVNNLIENLTRLNRSADLNTRSLHDILKPTRESLVQIQDELKHMNASHQLKLKERCVALVSMVETVKESLIKMNNASDSKMRRLQSMLENTKNNLILIQDKLIQLNYSLNTELVGARVSVASSIQDIRNDLTILTNSTTSKIRKVWIALNQTDENVVKILALLSHQNASFHTKTRKASQPLSTEVKNLGKKIDDIQNNTAKQFHRLGIDLNNTRDSLWKAHDQINQSNRSLHSAVDKLSTNLQNLVKNVNQKITRLGNNFATNKNDAIKQHAAIDDKISKTKDEFRESERKLKEGTSGLQTRMTEMKDDLKREDDLQKYEISKQQKQLKELQETVNKLTNKASPMLKSNLLVMILSVFALFSILG